MHPNIKRNIKDIIAEVESKEGKINPAGMAGIWSKSFTEYPNEMKFGCGIIPKMVQHTFLNLI
jgi:hypothetical protein